MRNIVCEDFVNNLTINNITGYGEKEDTDGETP